MKNIARIFLLTLSIICLSSPAISARQHGADGNQAEMFEKLLEYKHDFITKRLELTRDQQNKFFPLYDSMCEELNKLNNDVRQVTERTSKLSDAEAKDVDYSVATKANIEKGEKTSAIEKKYYAKFEEILKPKQLFKLKLAEQEINMKLIKKIKKKEGPNKSSNKK